MLAEMAGNNPYPEVKTSPGAGADVNSQGLALIKWRCKEISRKECDKQNRGRHQA
jgi:hypothetical protein